VTAIAEARTPNPGILKPPRRKGVGWCSEHAEKVPLDFEERGIIFTQIILEVSF
jgi:hypothetical protein